MKDKKQDKDDKKMYGFMSFMAFSSFDSIAAFRTHDPEHLFSLCALGALAFLPYFSEKLKVFRYIGILLLIAGFIVAMLGVNGVIKV